MISVFLVSALTIFEPASRRNLAPSAPAAIYSPKISPKSGVFNSCSLQFAHYEAMFRVWKVLAETLWILYSGIICCILQITDDYYNTEQCIFEAKMKKPQTDNFGLTEILKTHSVNWSTNPYAMFKCFNKGEAKQA
ncbi:unnamed protein product [Litomosoides sigmodontis]|uniref:Uncharacterized protein n=1 Tax=Litomosoides sigmodontis TaxID=42156 RepID=A0A3P6UMZ6_LITSI|nr:unnamed protein product [Litomosoides sigmodontis]